MFKLVLVAILGLFSWSQAQDWDFRTSLLENLTSSIYKATAFVNVNVIPLYSNRVLTGQTVIIHNNKIYQMGPVAKVKIPDHADRIDGSGKYLMPGLVDMHFHLPGPDADPNVVEAYLFFFVANGITTVRSTIGQSNHIDIRGRVRSGRLFGPTLYLACPPLSDDSVKTPQQAREFIQKYRTQGYDLIKNYGISDSAAYQAAAMAAKEAGLTFFGHVSKQMSIHRTIALGQSVEHLQGYYKEVASDSTKLNGLVEATRKAGIWNCPTQFWEEYLYEKNFDTLLAYQGMQYMPQKTVDQWVMKKKEEILKYAADTAEYPKRLAVRRKIIKALHDGGAKLVVGGDSPGKFLVPGFCYVHEMRAFIKAGLEPYDVLVCGTRSAAEYLGGLPEFGTIEVGKRADLILLEANPLEDINNVLKRSGVMLRGAWFTEEELKENLGHYAKLLE